MEEKAADQGEAFVVGYVGSWTLLARLTVKVLPSLASFEAVIRALRLT